MMQEDLTLTRSDAQEWWEIAKQQTTSLSKLKEKEKKGLAQMRQIWEEKDRAIDKTSELEVLIRYHQQKANEAQVNCENMGQAVHVQAEAMANTLRKLKMSSIDIITHLWGSSDFFIFVRICFEALYERICTLVYDIQTTTDLDVTNIAGIGGMTRSGRIYTPDTLQDKAPKEKKRTEEKEKEPEEETDELLKYIRQSEYSVIDQLNRTPVKITLLSLIMSSEPHRQALLKVLNEAYVAHSISQDKFEGIISHITANDHLTFTDEEIPPEGVNHNKPLHISVKCKEYLIAKVLVDNGSSLKVMPKRTLDQVTIEGIQMCLSHMIVRAFDGSKHEVIGEVTLPIQVGPTIFDVEFQVMDITPAYSCLLGRHWIHNAKAVPSMLYQKVKFVVGDKLVIVQPEDDMIISKPLVVPYVDATEEALETAFQALEIANLEKVPRMSRTTIRIMIKNGYQPGQGLGKDSQGVIEPPIIEDNPGKQGIGYDPSKERHDSKNKIPLHRSLDKIFWKARVQASKPAIIIKCPPSLQRAE
ncbi:hypothetical protein Fmac_024817 [Flemingia macrophylla]|uniref:G-patch domain-containing protein n=1 Tax=Flemingia macrophylla TaxID=520843 RepID=A0ABD1LQH5_9FABA